MPDVCTRATSWGPFTRLEGASQTQEEQSTGNRLAVGFARTLPAGLGLLWGVLLCGRVVRALWETHCGGLLCAPNPGLPRTRPASPTVPAASKRSSRLPCPGPPGLGGTAPHVCGSWVPWERHDTHGTWPRGPGVSILGHVNTEPPFLPVIVFLYLDNRRGAETSSKGRVSSRFAGWEGISSFFPDDKIQIIEKGWQTSQRHNWPLYPLKQASA